MEKLSKLPLRCHNLNIGVFLSNSLEEEPIAFGLKAIILSFAWNDEIDTEVLEAHLAKIEHVSSVEILDVRKAFG